ncbi:high-affinity branched-chain amino acid ABC transporter permease LivM [uncultured Ferrovibrio sp.]|jgi:branched-chain amino acid transport system permease protein|uniref:high-affinity branched-chain amino acid ABC transporter permease LivM n=1 Tax=uncultured Ferrovibrio sp. TaxID=1576913 RepID=UPI00262C82A9|nr:high-affinity branched-chain amino acid ABC transporter permease LivM [uncultured Ferrovibrio sp.]
MTFAQRLRDAGLAALVAAVLALPLLGFETIDTGGPLGIRARFHWIAYAAVSVFIGRLALLAFFDWWRLRQGRPEPLQSNAPARKDILTRIGSQADKYLMPALIAFAIALPMMPFADRTVVDLATVVLIYVMLGWGLNIVVGLAGLLDLGYVAFYAVGAYTYALLSLNFGFGFWEALPLAGLFAATFGIILGFPVLRLRGDYLAIVTLGFGEIIRVVLLNWTDVTRGSNGITGIQRPSFFGFPFTSSPEDGQTAFHELFGLEYSSIHRIIFLYYVILVLALITNLFTMRIRKLPIGRAWEALREDEIACKALGINPTNTKLTAFAIGAMFGGFAGSFFATRQGFISPESFSFIESAVILAIVVLGGMGSQAGIVLAAAFLTLLPELAREFSLFRMLAFGAAMVLIMIWRPQGLLAHREPTLRLSTQPSSSGGGKP